MPSLLRRGDAGDAVRELQTSLNAKGAAPPLVVDGEFGPATEAAVRAFQRSHSLEIDGIVGPKTWGELRKSEVRSQNAEVKGTSDFCIPTSALSLIAEARKYLAAEVRERPDGSNRGGPAPGQPEKYSVDAIQRPWFPEAGQAWCGCTVATWARAAGLPVPDWPPLVANWVEWARARGKLHWSREPGFTPKPGMFFTMKTDDGTTANDHIGLVLEVHGDTIVTAEGNSSNCVRSRALSRFDPVHYGEF